MKKIIIFITTILISIVAEGQTISTMNNADTIIDKNNSVEKKDEKIYTIVFKKATPEYDISEFVRKNIVYPDAAKKYNIGGRVMVSFVVEKDGTISNVSSQSKYLGYGLDEEAIRIVKMLPKFTPAENEEGTPVRSYFKLPINFFADRLIK